MLKCVVWPWKSWRGCDGLGTRGRNYDKLATLQSETMTTWDGIWTSCPKKCWFNSGWWISAYVCVTLCRTVVSLMIKCIVYLSIKNAVYSQIVGYCFQAPIFNKSEEQPSYQASLQGSDWRALSSGWSGTYIYLYISRWVKHVQAITDPIPRHDWRWFSFSPGGIC